MVVESRNRRRWRFYPPLPFSRLDDPLTACIESSQDQAPCRVGGRLKCANASKLEGASNGVDPNGRQRLGIKFHVDKLAVHGELLKSWYKNPKISNGG
jgi:hypothetical protein